MKIAIVSLMRGAAWGGSEPLWAAAAERALAEGHEVLLSLPNLIAGSSTAQELARRGAAIHRRRDSRYGRFDVRINRFIRPLRRLVRQKPDVYLISQGMVFDALHSGEIWELQEDCRSRNVPYLLLSHGNCEFGLQDPVKRQAGQRLFQQAWRTMFVARSLVALAERQLAARLNNAVVLNNPLNLSDSNIVPWPEPGSPVRMAHVSRVEVTSKGIDVLFEALSADLWKNRDWVLSVVGDGPAVNYLRELAEFFGIAGKVVFPGHTSDIRSVWRDHHLMVLPSRTEGVPISMIEAMVCGRPCLMTDVGGVREWIDDGRTGFLAEAPTPRSVGEALERAWSARELWKAIGQHAHQTAAARQDREPGQTLLNLLSEAAGGAGVSVGTSSSSGSVVSSMPATHPG